jgi:ssDNA-binding replication factor A large subunit
MKDFDKKTYRLNRKLGKRGQGSVFKDNIVKNETATIVFVDNKPTRANRLQRRLINKNKVKV